ncbi:MAG: Asp-tRNA(Asn)/Glu-tRNA(Gln) amidotransferase subunit GatC [Verrucomicrobiota bacterium]
MSQNHIDVRYVAALARLELTDSEAAEFQPQLDAIVGLVESLANLEDDDSPDAEATGPMRHDQPHESMAAAGLLRNAPEQAQGQVRVPKVVADA